MMIQLCVVLCVPSHYDLACLDKLIKTGELRLALTMMMLMVMGMMIMMVMTMRRLFVSHLFKIYVRQFTGIL